MDAYAISSIEKKTHYGVRASRILRPRYDEVEVGPFVYEVIEPLRKIRYACADNDFDISYDIEFEGVLPCHAEDTQYFMDNGRVVEHANRFDQSASRATSHCLCWRSGVCSDARSAMISSAVSAEPATS